MAELGWEGKPGEPEGGGDGGGGRTMLHLVWTSRALTSAWGPLPVPRPGLLTLDFLIPRKRPYLAPWWPHGSRIPLKWTKGFVGLRALPTRWVASTPPPGNHSGGPRPQPQLRSEGWDPMPPTCRIPAWMVRQARPLRPSEEQPHSGDCHSFRKVRIASSLKSNSLNCPKGLQIKAECSKGLSGG